MTTFDKALYFHDCEDEENVKSDIIIQITNPCKENNIYIKNLEETDIPDFYDRDFEVMFFDWGGMSLGNSMMEHFCNEIYKHAEDHPDRFYVMVSQMTKEAMKDAAKEFKEDMPHNIFLSVDDFGAWLSKYDEDTKRIHD